jgi:hypothetical protein
MNRGLHLILILLLFASSRLHGQGVDPSLPVFAGYLNSRSSGELFNLQWMSAQGGALRSWMKMSEKVGDFELISFDPASQTLSLRHANGNKYRVALRDGRVESILSDEEFKRLRSFLQRDRRDEAPVLDRGSARSFWLRLIATIAQPASPGIVLDLDGVSLPPNQRSWFLEGRARARQAGRLSVVVVINGKPTFHEYPRNAFGLPEPMTRHLLPSDWDELALLSVSERLPSEQRSSPPATKSKN